MTNTKARQLSSVPNTHRESTLRAIGQKAHSIDSRIEYLAVEGKRMKDLLAGVKAQGGDSSTRLEALHKALTAASN